jgi:transposase
MIWLARTGAPWRDLPSQYGSWKTVASRFYRWRRNGIFQRLLAEAHRRADACGELDWLCHYVDGSVVRAPQHAAGARHQPALLDAGAVKRSGPDGRPGRAGRAGVPTGWWPTSTWPGSPSPPSWSGYDQFADALGGT